VLKEDIGIQGEKQPREEGSNRSGRRVSRERI